MTRSALALIVLTMQLQLALRVFGLPSGAFARPRVERFGSSRQDDLLLIGDMQPLTCHAAERAMPSLVLSFVVYAGMQSVALLADMH
jgi:hypothetical protein